MTSTAFERLDDAGKLLKIRQHLGTPHPVPARWVEWLLATFVDPAPPAEPTLISIEYDGEGRERSRFYRHLEGCTAEELRAAINPHAARRSRDPARAQNQGTETMTLKPNTTEPTDSDLLRWARDLITEEMVTAAMRAFERMSAVLRYREKDKWHACDVMGMREAIAAALVAGAVERTSQLRAPKIRPGATADTVNNR